MRKNIFSIITVLYSGFGYSQVGIGTQQPSMSAQLEVVSQNKGMLIPRVGLLSTTDSKTISNGNVNSLLVFNTNTAGDVSPGYYYWYNGQWLRITNIADVQGAQKTSTVSSGTNNTVASAVTGNNTDYKITVPTASSTLLGVVKQAAANPTVTIAADGTLATLQPWNTVGGALTATTNSQNIYQAGKVGIGFGAADVITSALEVKGAATNKNSSQSTTMAIDFSLSNLASTTQSAGSFTLNNMKDGGTYTLAVKGTSAGTASFTHTGLTFRSVNNGTTIAGKQTVYTFIVMGTDAYYWMNSGF